MASLKLYVSPNEKFAFVGDVHFGASASSRIDNYMETLCRKIEAVGKICIDEGVHYIFFAGDIFDKISCSHECVNLAGHVFLDLQRKGLQLYSICGNHDLYRDNLKRMCSTPLMTLYFSGILEHISLIRPVEIYKSFGNQDEVSSVKITPCDYTQIPPPADDKFDKNILLAHMFYAKSGVMGDDVQNISKQRMETLGYDMAFLGHDHEPYDAVVCGKTTVVRTGSVMRGTSHDYNFTREPSFIIVDDIFNPTVFRKITIPHRPYKDVVSQAVLNRKAMGANFDTADREALKDLADKLAKVKEKKDKATDDVVLKAIETDTQIPDNCRKILLDYLQKVS